MNEEKKKYVIGKVVTAAVALVLLAVVMYFLLRPSVPTGIYYNADLEKGILDKISALSGKFAAAVDKLAADIDGYNVSSGNYEKALYCKDKLLIDMETVRKYADRAELILSKKLSPFPTYEDILYSIKYVD